MEKKLLSLFFFLFFFQFSFSQENRIEINGVIINQSSRGLVNSHIVNLTTKEGTVSDDEGKFTLKAKKGDWIQITNLQFLEKKIRITNGKFKARFLRIYLMPKTNLLEEVEIKRDLKGVLNLDLLKPEKDTIKEQMKSIVDYIMGLGYDKIINMGISGDERHLAKPKNSQLNTDPVAKFAGLPPASIEIPDKYLEEKRADRKFINFKEKFPLELKRIFGEPFFFERLKIPKENYYQFIEYCIPFGIEQLYKNKKHLDILKILLKASESYLQLLEKSK